MTDLDRIRQLAGFKPVLNEAEQTTWAADQVSAEDEAQMAATDARAERGQALEVGIKAAAQKSGVALRDAYPVYIQDDGVVEVTLDIANAWDLKAINNFRNAIGTVTNDLAYEFKIAIAGQDAILVTFKVEDLD